MKWDMPKSLHTATAIVNVAEHLITSKIIKIHKFEKQRSYHRAIYSASHILGYYPVCMPPEIYLAALAKLTKKMEN